ncbi:MAG TPA: hypothetical protein VNS81_07665 [Nocardioides sp.]|nr:hypothetical protein [Nocardioides sp.]
MRVAAAAVSTLLVLLAGGCGDDGSDEPDATPTPSTASQTPSPQPTATTTAPSESPREPQDTELTDSATPSPSRVEEISRILGCDLRAGTKSPEGATEYGCGEFLVVDWGTAGVTEQEMWDNVDSWVDEKRPSYIPADQFIIVYGTHDALEPHSKELLGR